VLLLYSVVQRETDNSEEHTASIFMIKSKSSKKPLEADSKLNVPNGQCTALVNYMR
jgi:hypothetical protein